MSKDDAEVNIIAPPWEGGKDGRGSDASYRETVGGSIRNLISPIQMYTNKLTNEVSKQPLNYDSTIHTEMAYYVPGFTPYWGAGDILSPLSGLIGFADGFFGKFKAKREVAQDYVRIQGEGMVLRNLKAD